MESYFTRSKEHHGNFIIGHAESKGCFGRRKQMKTGSTQESLTLSTSNPQKVESISSNKCIAKDKGKTLDFSGAMLDSKTFPLGKGSKQRWTEGYLPLTFTATEVEELEYFWNWTHGIT